jgi:prepilin-type N-terminal cleavage/methylation domain-containing protein
LEVIFLITLDELMSMRFKNSITLIELMVVLVVIGIIATFAVPGFRGARTRAYDRDARIELKQIQDAQRMHRLKIGSYVVCNVGGDNMAECENVLDLDFPPAPPAGYWIYSVPAASNATFCAQAVHDASSWHITQLDAEAQEGQCP